MSSSSGVNKKNSNGLFRPMNIVMLVIVIALGVGAFFGYKEYSRLKDENNRLSNPQESAKVETDKIKAEVSAILEVPTDEEPTIATVSDVSKLTNQAFFKNAKNGDKLIMYQKAKKAILYRPDTKKVIEVAPINIGDEEKKDSANTNNSTSTQTTTGTETTQTQDPAIQQPGITP